MTSLQTKNTEIDPVSAALQHLVASNHSDFVTARCHFEALQTVIVTTGFKMNYIRYFQKTSLWKIP